MGSQHVTKEERRVMVHLRSEGLDYREIAERLGRGIATVSRHMREMGHKRYGPLPMSDTVGRVTFGDTTVTSSKSAPVAVEGRPLRELSTVPDFLQMVHDLVELADGLRSENVQWMAEVERLESDNERLRNGADAASNGYKDLLKRGAAVLDR